MTARTIAHVFATFAPGGPQVRAVQLMRHLGPAFRHVVMAMDGRTEARAQLDSSVEFGVAEPPPPGGFFATRAWLRDWLRELSPDLVLTYNWGAIETVAAARALGSPHVHHEDGFGPEEVARRFRRRNWLRRLLLRSTPVIVPSAVLEGIARREWGVRSADLHLLPNGVDLQRFAPVAGSVEERHDAPLVVGSVGGLRGEKDHDNLVHAFALATGGKQGAAAPRLRLVGDGPLRPALTALAAELGIGDRIDFVGAVADTAPEYRQMDVFVLSSRTEQMPISLLEAMATGCAVVATDVGDIARILPAAQAPFVVPREDHSALGSALAAVLDDAALRARLGAANRARVTERYEAVCCLDRFGELYTRVADRAGTATR